MDTPTQVSNGGHDELQRIGSFVVLSKLGQGGMGAVYKAHDPALDRTVALKLLPPHLAADQAFITRFHREAAAAAKLSHSNLVQVYAAGMDAGTHFIAMEFVEGPTLKHHIEDCHQINCQEALAISIHAAEALRYAWNKSKLIHRDIKPDNILLSTDGEVKVADLGLAKMMDSVGTDFTSTGTVMGSPHYISPEQARGDKEIDFRTDIYSLGATLYHMLTGLTPYQADSTVALMYKHVHEPPPDPTVARPDCPASVASLVKKMMAKDPTKRPATYDELIAEMTAAHDALTKPNSTPAKSRKPLILAGAAIAVAAVAIAGVVLWKTSSGKHDTVPTALGTSNDGASASGTTVVASAVTSIAPPPAVTRPATTVTPTNPITATLPSSKEIAAPTGEQQLARVSKPNGANVTTSVNPQKEITVDLGGGVTMEFVLIPAGSFMMGSENSTLRINREIPVHKVTITKPFYIGKYEVTQKQWEKVMGENPSKNKRSTTNPVEQLSWDDCQNFVAKLKEKLLGQTFRLPSEAEWEYACRAGSTGDYCYGNDLNRLDEYAWYSTDIKSGPHPVGEKKPNAWGLYDMHGNVQEWCQDDFHDTYKDAPVDGSAWMQDSPNGQHVLRSGSVNMSATYCRSAHRSWRDASRGVKYFGVRIVAEIKQDGELTEAPVRDAGLAAKTESSKPAPVVTNTAPVPAPVVVTPTNDFVATAAALPADKQLAAVLAKLKELNPLFDGKETHKIEAGAVTELAISSVGVIDLTPLRALRWLKKLSVVPVAANQKGTLSDLSALTELPLTGLWCHNNPIRDLAPLKGMALTMLSIGGTQISDLDPLAGMKLTVLSCNDTEVSNLKPLEKMPLTLFWCQNTKVTDLTPVRAAPLQELRCNAPVAAQNIPVLSSIKTLTKINDLSAATFFLSTTIPKSPVVNAMEWAKLPKEMTIELGGGVTMEFVLIPAGSFTMGSKNGRPNEQPVHMVKITKPFYIGKYMVTQKQWEQITGDNPSRNKRSTTNPVDTLMWDDCQKFVARLKAKLPNQTFRLPSEAEWEYACRAGSTGDFCYGDGFDRLGEYAWYKDNSNYGSHPVGEKKPNAWGLYDMHGNVQEWCQDVYHQNYKSAPSDGSAWMQDNGNNDRHVSRGGSAGSLPAECRSACRLFYTGAAGTRSSFGVRIVVEVR